MLKCKLKKPEYCFIQYNEEIENSIVSEKSPLKQIPFVIKKI